MRSLSIDAPKPTAQRRKIPFSNIKGIFHAKSWLMSIQSVMFPNKRTFYLISSIESLIIKETEINIKMGLIRRFPF